jgi:hypothetical protein
MCCVTGLLEGLTEVDGADKANADPTADAHPWISPRDKQ